MSNNFGSGLAVGMALGHSAGRSAGKEEATEEFDNEETASIARVLLAHPAFAKAVRKTIDELNAAFGKPQDYIDEQSITPATRTGFLWLFRKEAQGAEADAIRGQARGVISGLFNTAGKDLGEDYIKHVAQHVAADAESYDGNYTLGRGAEFVMALQDGDYAHMARIGTMETEISGLEDIATSKDEARSAIAETEGLGLSGEEGRVYNRMLVNTVKAYAAATADNLTAHYNKALEAANPATANDNADEEPAAGRKRGSGSPAPGR